MDGSPAIDAGDPREPGSGSTACAAVDERGLLRPLGADGELARLNGRAPSHSPRFRRPVVATSAGVCRRLRERLYQWCSGQAHAGRSTDIVGLQWGGRWWICGFGDVRPCRQAHGPMERGGSESERSFQTLLGGFIVEAGRAADVWVEVVGVLGRPHFPSRFTILYGNRGNVDGSGAFVHRYVQRLRDQFGVRYYAAASPGPAGADQLGRDLDHRAV